MNSATTPVYDFADPLHRHLLYRARGVGLCAYAIALAAFQRGLSVTFHYNRERSERFPHSALQGGRGEMFSISDGTNTHYFNRSEGDLSSQHASAISHHKQKTKALMREHGVPVPEGVLVNRGEVKKVEAFLRKHPAKRFIIKPLDGSLGSDVHRHLSAEQVVPTLNAGAELTYLVEEQVSGPEYRVLVVDGRCVFAYQRIAAQIKGDGEHSVAQLIAAQNKLRKQHPYFFDKPIEATAEMVRLLKQQTVTMATVPEPGREVVLSMADSVHHGGSMIDVTNTLPEWVKKTAINAQRASGLPFVGIDLIVSSQNAEGEYAVVLETNSRAHIQPTLLSPDFESYGNTVADAMVDYYFPESVSNQRFPKATFDFSEIVRTLQTGQVSALTLPTLTKEWVHERSTISNQELAVKIKGELLRQGLYGNVYELNVQTKTWVLDVLAPRAHYKSFLKRIK